LRKAARSAGAYVAIGINERNVEASGTSLYNSLLFINADGALLGVHRRHYTPLARQALYNRGAHCSSRRRGIVAGPLHEERGFVFAEVDPQRITGPRWQLDVAGHYARPDVLQLVVRGR
jgi:nitrilase